MVLSQDTAVGATQSLTVALWATNLASPLAGIEAWSQAVEVRLRKARADGAELLVLPEYMAEQWLSFAPAGLTPADEIPWMASHADAALAAIGGLPERYGVAILAGTMPVATEGAAGYRNRAHLLLPDGRVVAQDKLCLTPSERDPRGWNLDVGDRVRIVQWGGLRLATLICLDVELPVLSALLAPHEPDLILVPSQTARLSGYSRVFNCARARAVELQAAVAAVGCIGGPAWATSRDRNVGGAGVYLPCEQSLGHTGRFAETPPTSQSEDEGPLLLARDVPLGEIRRLRAGAAEVWPGAWRGDRISILEA